MPVQFVLEILRFLLGIVALSVPVAIIAFVGRFLYNDLRRNKKVSWLRAFFSVAFLFSFVFVLVLYALPFAGVTSEIDAFAGTLTTELVEVNGELVQVPYSDSGVIELLVVGIVSLFRVAAVALIISLLLLPPGFVGDALHSAALGKKKKRISGSRKAGAFFVACFAGTLFAVMVVLLFPWIPAGLLYLLYFA